MFHIGQKIVCVEDGLLPHTIDEIRTDMPNWIKKGEKYHVRGFCENDGIVLGIHLEEVINPVRFFRLINRSQEGAFRADRFRELQDSEVEVEVEELEKIF